MMMEAEEKIKNFCGGRFTVSEKLGEGTYGEVFYAFDNQKQTTVAIKKVKFHGRQNQGIPPTTLREIAILKEINHKNIVGLDDVIMSMDNDSESGLYLVFKMMEMDLKKLIRLQNGRIPPNHVKQLLHQILEGVDYLHSNKILHRDLKPENILLSKEEYRVKICDFGLARTVHQPLRPYTEEILSLWYRAPELCISNKNYSVGVDTWAIGCIFAELVTGRPLFMVKQASELLLLIVKTLGNPANEVALMPEEQRAVMKNIPDQKEKDLSSIVFGLEAEGLNLLRKLLTLNPLNRITCKQALSHPYFRDMKSD